MISYRKPRDQDDVRTALAAGRLQMQRPQGDWVTCHPRNNNPDAWRNSVAVYMEREVEAAVTAHTGTLGYPGVRIVT